MVDHKVLVLGGGHKCFWIRDKQDAVRNLPNTKSHQKEENNTNSFKFIIVLLFTLYIFFNNIFLLPIYVLYIVPTVSFICFSILCTKRGYFKAKIISLISYKKVTQFVTPKFIYEDHLFIYNFKTYCCLALSKDYLQLFPCNLSFFLI